MLILLFIIVFDIEYIKDKSKELKLPNKQINIQKKRKLESDLSILESSLSKHIQVTFC